MKFRIAVVAILIIFLFSFQVNALELDYEGQKDFWAGLNLMIFEDIETGKKIYEQDWSFGQSVQISFSGQDEMDFIHGYLTDHPELLDQIYLDLQLGSYSLSWDNYSKAFLVPSWFNLEQHFQGLRFGYNDQQNGISLVGVRGDNYLREEEIIIYPGDEAAGISLEFFPIVIDSVMVWLDNKELQYGQDYFIDYNFGVIFLQIPIFKTSLLKIKYSQNGESYLVFGGRFDHYFGPELNGGVTLLETKGQEMKQSLLGSEWFLQLSPIWAMELNAGMVLENSEFNFRWVNHLDWPGLNLNAEYQVVRNNLNNLLYNGWQGKSLHLSGNYEKDNLFFRLEQNYEWTLTDLSVKRAGELEFVLVHANWIPYLYYSQSVENDLTMRHGIFELGYQTEINQFDSLIYLMGVETKSSADNDLYQDIEPYLGAKYRIANSGSIGARIYGKEGLKFAQLVVEGDWSRSDFLWQGQLDYLPAYYQFEQKLSWTELPLDIDLNLTQGRFLNKDQEHLDLGLTLDWTELAQAESRIWINLLRNQLYGQLTQTFVIGGERSLRPNLLGYGEISRSQMENSYTGGVRGFNGLLEYDLNYIFTDASVDEEKVKTKKITFSLGINDYWNTFGELTMNNHDQWTGELGLKYPIMSNLELGITYSGSKSYWTNHQLTLNSTYYF